MNTVKRVYSASHVLPPEFSGRRVWPKEQKRHRTGRHRRQLVPSGTKKLRDDAGRIVPGGPGSFHSSGPSSGWASFSCREQVACTLACLSRGCICAGRTQRPLVNPSQARRIVLKNSPVEFFSGTGSYVPSEPTVMQKRVTLYPLPPDPQAVGSDSPEARGKGKRGGYMKKGRSLRREKAIR